MNISSSNFITSNTVLSDILKSVDDEAFTKFSKGYYISLIQQSLEELDFATFLTKKIEYFDYDSTLEIPKNCWNIREIYLFDGDCCDPTTARTVWWKRNFRGNKYANRVTSETDDPYLTSFSSQDDVYYYNAENGYIYFSSACDVYSRVMIVFNGLNTPIGDTPMIPLRLRRYVHDKVVMEVFAKLKSRVRGGVNDLKIAGHYRSLYADAYQRLYDKQNGSWNDMIVWVNSMDSKARQDLLEYLSKMNY